MNDKIETGPFRLNVRSDRRVQSELDCSQELCKKSQHRRRESKDHQLTCVVSEDLHDKNMQANKLLTFIAGAQSFISNSSSGSQWPASNERYTCKGKINKLLRSARPQTWYKRREANEPIHC
jgi:hypothetical protein